MAETSSMPEKKWAVREQRADLSRAISSCLNISPLVAQVLINRGLETPEAAQSFLSPRLADLHAPLLMKGMDRAVARIAQALHKKEKISICGDYDVDGITATTVLVLFLESAGAQVTFHIPSRLTEGYGMSAAAIRKLHSQGVTLIVTVDCGISAVREIDCVHRPIGALTRFAE
jgi:single-stranded-DNA-specific exonuclease